MNFSRLFLLSILATAGFIQAAEEAPEEYENTREGSPSRESSPESSPRLSEAEIAQRKAAALIVFREIAKENKDFDDFAKSFGRIKQTDSPTKRQLFINKASEKAIEMEQQKEQPNLRRIEILKAVWKPVPKKKLSWGTNKVRSYPVEVQDDYAYLKTTPHLNGVTENDPLPTGHLEETTDLQRVSGKLPEKIAEIIKAQQLFNVAMQSRDFRFAVKDMNDTDAKIRMAMEASPENSELLSKLLSDNIARATGIAAA